MANIPIIEDLTSPSGHMSKRARKAAEERNRIALFGKEGLQKPAPIQPTKKEKLMRMAATLRDLAGRGMKPRAYLKEAIRLEKEAKESHE